MCGGAGASTLIAGFLGYSGTVTARACKCRPGPPMRGGGP